MSSARTRPVVLERRPDEQHSDEPEKQGEHTRNAEPIAREQPAAASFDWEQVIPF